MLRRRPLYISTGETGVLRFPTHGSVDSYGVAHDKRYTRKGMSTRPPSDIHREVSSIVLMGVNHFGTGS